MVRKDCPTCDKSSYSSDGKREWICPTCGADLTNEPEKPAERSDDDETNQDPLP